MSVLLAMLSDSERTTLNVIARACVGRYRPLDSLLVSKTAAKALAKLGLIDMRRGHLDKARIVRLSFLGERLLKEEKQ